MWSYPTVIAHRGAGKLAPENTLAALRRGWQHGFRAVEFDAMLARDGVPVLMHDPQLGRTVAGSGRIDEFDAAQLGAMDAGLWFNLAFRGEPVPTLQQAMAFCVAHRIWMNIEIKPIPGTEARTARAVAQMVAAQFAKPLVAVAPPLLSSFSFDALQMAHQLAPQIARGYLADTIPADWQSRLQQLAAVALHTNHQHLTPALAADIKRAGYGLMCYTVNQPERVRELFSWGVDAVCTDRIDLIAPDFDAGAALAGSIPERG